MIQPRLVDVPPATFDTMDMDDANELLVGWGHRLGPLARPFSMRAYAFLVDGEPVSVAMSASAVGSPVAGYRRQEVVELARLCSALGRRWATRVMIRVWREVFARRWPDWPVRAAISYQQNAHYRGDIYRFDGWERVSDNCGGSRGGGTWTHKRPKDSTALGSKSLWLWHYPLVVREWEAREPGQG